MRATMLRKSNFIDSQLPDSVITDRQALLLPEQRYSQLSKRLLHKATSRALAAIADQSTQQKSEKLGIFRILLRQLNKFPILNPQKLGVLIWSIINLFIINFYLFQIGFLLGFGSVYWQDELNYFYYGNILFIIFFIFDLIISPLKAYYENGMLIQNRVVIFKHYIRSGLWIDLLGLLGVIIPYVNQSVASNLFKLLFLGKIYNAYEIDKYLLMIVRNKFKHAHVYAIARVVYLTILWSHYLGVGFFAIDYMVYQTNYYGPNTPNVCWIFNSVLDYNITQSPWWIQYLYSLYFSVGNITTIAYGDIVARNPIEAVFVIFSMIVTIMLFTYFFKSILQIIFFAQADSFENENNLMLINTFIRQNKVNLALGQKIKSYFQINWRQQRFRNRQIQLQLIEQLPKNLKIDLYLAFFGKFIGDIGLLNKKQDLYNFQNKSTFLFEIFNAIQFQRVTAGQILYKEGEQFQQHQYVYYCDQTNPFSITLGQRQITDLALKIDPYQKINEHQLNQIHFSSIKIGHICGVFGQTSFFNEHPRNHWAITNKNIQILKLSKSQFTRIAEKHANSSEKQRIFQAKQNIQNRFCYICLQKGHNFQKCHYATYVSNHLHLIPMLSERSKRENNSKITKLRMSWQSYVIKNHCWKHFNRMKKEGFDYEHKAQNWSANESQGDGDDFRTDFIEELLQFSNILKNEVKQQKFIQNYDDLNVDIGYKCKIYKVQFNYDRVIKRYAQQQLLKIKRRQAIL